MSDLLVGSSISCQRKKKSNKNEEGLRLESRVFKIHPTVQTKGGMKMGVNAGEKSSGGKKDLR